MRWYLLLILSIITAFAPLVMEQNRVQKAEALAQTAIVPRLSATEIQTEIDRLRVEFRNIEDGRISDNPLSYWKLLDDQSRVQWQIEVLRRLGSDEEMDHYPRLGAMSSNLFNRLSSIQTSYNNKFGSRKMATLAMTVTRTFVPPIAPEIPNRRFELFLMGYAWSIIPMLLVFVLRLFNLGLMIWVEIPRIIIASVLWPVSIFLYPRDIRRAEQIKVAMQFVANLASVTVGFFGGGVVNMVKAQASPNGKNTSQSEKKGNSTFGYGLELYPQTSGIDAGLMVSPWYAHSHALPKGFSLSGFGFVEAGERKGQFFTNHSMNLSHAKAFGAMFTLESGGSVAGSFVQVGPRVNLIKIPGFPKQTTKIVKSVVAGSLWRIRGPTHYQEWYLSWVSKEATLPGGWKLSSEGFMRFRPGPRVAAGEPQLILRHPKIPHTQFVSEFWMLGTQPTIRLGVQFSK